MPINDREEGFHALWMDVHQEGLPDAELMARYATAPNELSEEERRLVEAALASQPAAADELDTLRHFDFSALDADLVGEAGRESWLARFFAFIARPATAGVAATAIAGAVLVLNLDPAGSGPGTANPSDRLAASDSVEIPEKAPSRPGAPGFPELPGAEQEGPVLAEVEPATPVEPGAGEALARNEATPESTGSAVPEPSMPAREDESVISDAPGVMLLAMNTPRYERPYGAADREFMTRGTFRSQAPGEIPAFSLAALAPEHVARSAAASPRLFWFVDQLPAEGEFHVTVASPDGEQILLDDVSLASPERTGIQSIDLAARGVVLDPGVEYRWSISHRDGPEAAPTGFALGWLEVMPLAEETQAEVMAASPGERPDLWARAGYFHDALTELVALQAEYPNDDRVRAALAALLRQAGVILPGNDAQG